jgi:hypothetical protein
MRRPPSIGDPKLDDNGVGVRLDQKGLCFTAPLDGGEEGLG